MDGTTPPAERTDAEVVVHVCGAVRVDGPARSVPVPGRQPQVVLAHLALEGGQASRERLAAVLWGDVLSDHWPGALRGVVSKVRAALVEAGLAPGAIRIEGGAVHLAVRPGLVSDVDLAVALVADAERHLAAKRPGPALDAAERSQATTDRPFLDHHDDEWSRHHRHRLAELTARAVHVQLAALVALGRTEDAVAGARQRLAAEPLDERAHHLLVEALVTGGRPAAAAQAYDELASVLRRELGVAPAPATAALVAEPPHPVRPAAPGTRTPWSPASSSAIRRSRVADDERFVGRGEELAALADQWSTAVATGVPRVVVLEGPPGVGKTRLADRFAAERTAAGDRVLWGRGRADAGLAYGPFAEALDAALAEDPTVVERLGARAAGLVALLPHLADALGGYRRPDDDAMARTHLFAAVSAAVDELADRPCLLVLDDLQWVGLDAMALLEAVLDGRRAPLLVLASTRPASGPPARALASLQRVVEVSTVRLDGLPPGALAELLAGHRLATGADATDVAAELHRRTAGLPFYVADIVRAADLADAPIDPRAIPPTTRAWIARRVAALADGDRHLLEAAAVLDAPVAPQLLAVDPASPVDLGGLVAEGLLRHRGDGLVELAHVLTRDAVYDAIDPPRRAGLHRRTADLLARVDPAGRPRQRPDHPTLAHHRRRSGPADHDLAAHHALAAGLEALDQGAWERAADHLGHALDEDRPAPERTRALVAAGRAHHLLGHHDRARRLLEEALSLARHHAMPIEQAEATLALVGRGGRGAAVGVDDDRQVALLRDAVEAMDRSEDRAAHDDGPSARRRAVLACRLDTELAMALLLSDAAEERGELLARARRRAEALAPPSPSATAWALLAGRYALLGPGELHERLDDLERVLALPAVDLPPEVVVAAHCYQHEDLLRLGRTHDAADALTAAEAVLARHPIPYWSWAVPTWRGLSANLAGDLDQAEAIAVAAAARRPDIPEAQACLGVNLVGIRAYQRRAGEVLDLLEGAAAASPEVPCYRAVLALCAAEAGEQDLAQRTYGPFAESGFALLPADTNRFLGLGVLAHVAAELGDADGARALTALLAPYRGQWILLNCYGGGGAHWGPTSHQLARLAAVEGRGDDAVELFAEAEAQASAAGAPLVLDRIRADVRRRLPAVR